MHSSEYLVLKILSIVNLKASSSILGINFSIKGELIPNPGLLFISKIHNLKSLSKIKSYPNISKHNIGFVFNNLLPTAVNYIFIKYFISSIILSNLSKGILSSFITFLKSS